MCGDGTYIHRLLPLQTFPGLLLVVVEHRVAVLRAGRRVVCLVLLTLLHRDASIRIHHVQLLLQLLHLLRTQSGQQAVDVRIFAHLSPIFGDFGHLGPLARHGCGCCGTQSKRKKNRAEALELLPTAAAGAEVLNLSSAARGSVRMERGHPSAQGLANGAQRRRGMVLSGEPETRGHSREPCRAA